MFLKVRPDKEPAEAHHQQTQKWDVTKGLVLLMESKHLFDSFWQHNYPGLKRIMNQPTAQPDIIIADFCGGSQGYTWSSLTCLIAVAWTNLPFWCCSVRISLAN